MRRLLPARVAVCGMVAGVLLAAVPAAQATPPHRASLSIPSIGIHPAPLVGTGTRRAQVVVPRNVRRVGWWRGSRRLDASSGSSLVVGHIADSKRRGALWRLHEIRRGARIRTVWKGHVRWWRVTRISYTRRTRDLPKRVWRLSGPRTLNLVTCAHRVVYPSGYYHYRDNLAVTAVPVGPHAAAGKRLPAQSRHESKTRADR